MLTRNTPEKEVGLAFEKSEYSVYIAGQGLREQSTGNIYIAPYYIFKKCCQIQLFQREVIGLKV